MLSDSKNGFRTGFAKYGEVVSGTCGAKYSDDDVDDDGKGSALEASSP